MKAVLDTNILIDYLRGLDQARSEIDRYAAPLISPITWMEVLAGASPEDEPALRAFLGRFAQIPVDRDVAEQAVSLRRAHRIRLPDAIIWASARVASALLVTRNTRDFPVDDPGVRVPYRV